MSGVTSTPTRVVVLDYGGVLGDHHQDPAESALASILACGRENCRALLSERSEHGLAFREDRISEEEFWATVFNLAGCARCDGPPDAVLSRLWSETYSLNVQVLSVLEAVRMLTPVGVLTNIDRVRSEYLINHTRLLRYIDVYLPSFRFNAVKPKEALWRSADAEIRSVFGGHPAVLYIDDRATHVDACAAAGWEGMLYRNVTQLEEQLRARDLIPHERAQPMGGV